MNVLERWIRAAKVGILLCYVIGTLVDLNMQTLRNAVLLPTGEI